MHSTTQHLQTLLAHATNQMEHCHHWFISALRLPNQQMSTYVYWLCVFLPTSCHIRGPARKYPWTTVIHYIRQWPPPICLRVISLNICWWLQVLAHYFHSLWPPSFARRPWLAAVLELWLEIDSVQSWGSDWKLIRCSFGVVTGNWFAAVLE